MQINSNSDTVGIVYAADAPSGKNTTAATPPTASPVTDTVTLSAAARKLVDGIGQLNDALAQLPPPSPKPRTTGAGKKRPASQLAMLDVDAMRLIRDKLRLQNLGLTDTKSGKPTKPAEQSVKVDKAEDTAIQK